MIKISVKLQYSLFTLIILAFSFLFAPKVKASVIFEDNFNDNDFSDWTVQRNMQWSQNALKCKDGTVDANWRIDNGRLGIKIDGPSCVTEITPNIWNGSLANYIVDLDISFVSGTDKNVAFRYASPNQWYDLKFDSKANSVSYQQLPHSGDIQSTNYLLPNGQTYHLKIVVNSGDINTFIDGNQVIQSIFDANLEFSPLGKLALQASVGADPLSEVYFDNIVVTSIDPSPTPSPTPSSTPSPTQTPTPTPTTTPTPTIEPTQTPTTAPTPTPLWTPVPTPYIFPAFYQTDPLWSTTQYDSAGEWNPLDPSFGRWGCAVTSSAMILKYYGIVTLPNGLGTTPGNLNAWLSSVPGGYIDGGLVNWQMISKATAIMHITNPFWTKLEYSWGNNSRSALQTELTSGRPAILQVNPGHFVAAYQVGSQNKIDIVDPYFPKTTLADYGGTFVSMRKFQPSFTDFSHITMYAQPESTITLEKKIGNSYKKTDAVSYSEELWGQPGNQRSSPATTVIDLSKPTDGAYRLKLSQKKPRLLHYTLIVTDIEGNESITKNAVLAGPLPRFIQFEYEKTSSQSAILAPKVDFDTLDQDYDVAKSIGAVKKKYDCRDITYFLQFARVFYKHNKELSRLNFEHFAKQFTKQKALFDTEVFELITHDIDVAREQLF